MTHHHPSTPAATKPRLLKHPMARAFVLSSLLMGLLAAGSSHSQPINPLTMPTGGRVTAGKAAISAKTDRYTITVNGKTQILAEWGNTDVTQYTQRAAIDWSTFSIGKDATVNFYQPSASAVMLNRVTGSQKSVIEGALNADGKVYVLNANGILFAKDAQVNVVGLVASTLGMSNADFMAGKTTFSGNGNQGSVVNQGTLTATDGGYIALLGKQVSNEGTVTAKLGTAALSAGNKITLKFDSNNSLWAAAVDQGTLKALVENKNAIIADGGTVTLSGKGLDTVMATVVKNTGLLRAQTIGTNRGRIALTADNDNDRIDAGGKIDTTAPNGGKGGYVDLYGAHLRVVKGAIDNSKGITTYVYSKDLTMVDALTP